MDKYHSSTKTEEQKMGKHLTLVERGAIQYLKKFDYSNNTTNCVKFFKIVYELKRGTTTYSVRGRKPGYSARQGNKIYQSNQKCCRCPKVLSMILNF